MKKGQFVFAVTRADLVKVYGESRQLRELVRQLEGSRDAEESLGLLTKFDDANWLQWASPSMAPEFQEAGLASATIQ